MRVRGGSGAAAGPVPPPAGLRPMQPTAARELPADQASWAFEPKWDGYRALGHVRVGTALLAATAEQGLEGVVAKRLASTYQPGRRTRHWLKVKHYQRETFLVGGFVPDPGGQVRSLLVGLPDPRHEGRLRFAGRVDHGLVPAARRRVGDLLAPWPPARARSPSRRRPWSAAAGAGPGRTTRPRCSSGPRWPWRSPSSAGRAAGCATRPTAAWPPPGARLRAASASEEASP